MSVLNPTLLAWLVPLLFLPILIHLLNKKYPRLFAFSSVENLRRTIARRSKLLRFRHLILVLLRTIALALLLIAFLKPVLPRFGSAGPGGGARHVLILCDHSLSMEYRGQSMVLRKKAVLEAEKILANLGPDDLVNILIVDQTPSACFVEFSNNHGAARQFLENLKPGLGRADFNQANAAAAQRLARAGSRPEVYYISDFQRKNWANVDFRPLPANARLFFVDVVGGGRQNRGILGAEVCESRVLAGETANLEVEVGNYTDRPMDDPLKVTLDEGAVFEKQVSIAPWSAAKVMLPVLAGSPGVHLCEISLPADDLPEDDRHFLTIEVAEKEEVLIVSDEEDAIKSGLYFLQTALNPYENLRGSLLPRRLRSTEISGTALAGAKKVFLTRIARLDDAACAALGKFLFQGAGLVYFLDGESDAENLARLERVIGAGAMPMKLGPRRVAENIATGVQQIGRGDFKSPYLKLFRGATRQNLGLLEFYDSYQAAATGVPAILLSYTDGSPAMGMVNYGQGTMLLMNFSVSEFSSNLARQRIFPAWMQEIVKNLNSDQHLASSCVVGDVIFSEVWRNELKNNEFKTPAGTPANLKMDITGERCAISFAPDQLGFYTLRAERLLHAFAVNTPPEESDLRSIDKDQLPDWLNPGQQGHFVKTEGDFEDLITGRPLFPWFVGAALLILLIEVAFQWLVKRRSS